MQHVRLRVQSVLRAVASDDDAEGEHLVGLVRSAVERGSAAPVAVVSRTDRLELLSLAPVREAGIELPAFLAGLTRAERSDRGAPAGPLSSGLAVGLAGRFLYRPRGAAPGRGGGSPVALAFLEWPDCRWWLWQAVLDADGALVNDSEIRRRATDGDALPGGLGRWWSLGRRVGAVVRYGAPEPRSVPASPLVH